MTLQLDLVNTIGEAAALGTAGVISWGDMNVTDTEVGRSDVTLDLFSLNILFCLQINVITTNLLSQTPVGFLL